MSDDISHIDLAALLKRLNLATVARVVADFEWRAAEESWTNRGFLLRLFAEEVANRANTRVTKLARCANFPFLKTIEEFDFAFRATVRRTQLGPYLGPEFITEGHNLILSVKPGRRKTHLAVARAGTLRETTATYVQPHVLVTDEVGLLQHADAAANVLCGVIDQRCPRRRPIVFTPNKKLREWGQVLHDEQLAEALLDRVLERGQHITLGGRSWRTRNIDPATLGKGDSEP